MLLGREWIQITYPEFFPRVLLKTNVNEEFSDICMCISAVALHRWATSSMRSVWYSEIERSRKQDNRDLLARWSIRQVSDLWDLLLNSDCWAHTSRSLHLVPVSQWCAECIARVLIPLQSTWSVFRQCFLHIAECSPCWQTLGTQVWRFPEVNGTSTPFDTGSQDSRRSGTRSRWCSGRTLLLQTLHERCGWNKTS